MIPSESWKIRWFLQAFVVDFKIEEGQGESTSICDCPLCARHCTEHFASIIIAGAQPPRVVGVMLPFCRWGNHGLEGRGSTAELPNWSAGMSCGCWAIDLHRPSGARMEAEGPGTPCPSPPGRTQPPPHALPVHCREPRPQNRPSVNPDLEAYRAPVTSNPHSTGGQGKTYGGISGACSWPKAKRVLRWNLFRIKAEALNW